VNEPMKEVDEALVVSVQIISDGRMGTTVGPATGAPISLPWPMSGVTISEGFATAVHGSVRSDFDGKNEPSALIDVDEGALGT